MHLLLLSKAHFMRGRPNNGIKTVILKNGDIDDPPPVQVKVLLSL